MAGSKSDYLENVVLDSILGKSSTALSTGSGGVADTVYLALYNSTINDTVTSLTDECAGTTYARLAVTNSSASWRNSSGGSKTNKITMTFTTAAGSDWGTVKSFAIHDGNSTSAGNVYYWGDLSSNQTISSGNVVRFSTGAIVVTES